MQQQYHESSSRLDYEHSYGAYGVQAYSTSALVCWVCRDAFTGRCSGRDENGFMGGPVPSIGYTWLPALPGISYQVGITPRTLAF